MGRHVGDPTNAVNSSIALLQERFRELQKVREKRQEKELLKLFSESERVSPTTSMHFEPNKLSLQTNDMFHPNGPTPPHIQDSLLSLGLNSQSRRAAVRSSSTSPRSPWGNISSTTATGSSSSSSSRNFETSDVDTSLHL